MVGEIKLDLANRNVVLTDDAVGFEFQLGTRPVSAH